MLLQRIELMGFLSHYGQRDGSGKIQPTEIDFRSSPLWLIYGPNGAGKSALFDAITFALYKQHRGQKTNFERLINDSANKAEVNLEIELGGQRYLVQRTITPTGRGARVWGIVRHWTGDDWLALPGTTNSVEKWVEHNLRMSYDTFVSAVVLRQGEADAFLKAKPAERKSRLLELLDLKFYEKLGEAANSRRTEWSQKLRVLQKELDRLSVVSGEDLTAQHETIALGEIALANARHALADKELELADASRAARLTAEIAQKEVQQRSDAKLMEQAKRIHSDVSRYHDLKANLPLLDNLWAARSRLADEVNRIESANTSIVDLQAQIAKLDSQAEKARQDEDAADAALTQSTIQLGQTRARQQELTRQLEKLGEIESLEQQIRNADESLKPYKFILDRASDIERAYETYEKLRERVPLLKTMRTAEASLVEAQEKSRTSQAFFNDCQRSVSEAKTKEQRSEIALQTTNQVFEETKDALSGCNGQLALLYDKMTRREGVIGADECPVCGSRLDSIEQHARLEQDRMHWQAKIGELEGELGELLHELEVRERAKRDAHVARDVAREVARNAEKKMAGAQSDLEHARIQENRADTARSDVRQQAGRWADQLHQLATLEAELDSLRTAAEQLRALEIARREESAAQATIVSCRTRLAELPAWSTEERAHLQLDVETSEREAKACQTETEAMERKAKAARSWREELENQQRTLENNLKLHHHSLNDLQRRRQQAETDADRSHQALPLAWVEHPACTDVLSLAELKQEMAALSGTGEEERRLSEAQARSTRLSGAIEALKQEFGEIPAAHRRLVAEVEAERKVALEAADHKESELDQARRRLATMEEQKRTYEERRLARDAADTELSYYNRLARALGRGGLQAKIVQAAQENLKLYANNTLAHLSNGIWQIELEENDQKTELEIFARDLSQPSTPLRSFEYLSGGEKFRVAVSLAVAIGQSISGGRTVDTLVIDEGFGALDEINRSLLVNELRRLSEDVLKGGRVIVVSHEEDVREEFGYRYHISKDAEGVVQVSRSQ